MSKYVLKFLEHVPEKKERINNFLNIRPQSLSK